MLLRVSYVHLKLFYMKQLFLFSAVLLLILSVLPFAASAQKIMKVDDSLKSNGVMMEVKSKGLSALHKYELGSYKVVSGKAGITTTKTKSKFFSRFSQSASTQKSSFVFVGSNTDSVLVDMYSSLKSDTKTTHNLAFSREGTKIEKGSELLQSKDSFVAIITLPFDTTEWQLTSIIEYDINSQKYKWNRVLSDGETSIEIIEVNVSDNGKQSLLWICHGYEFFLDKKSIAAVQTMMKQFVWINKGLDQNKQLLLAAACATLLQSPQRNRFTD